MRTTGQTSNKLWTSVAPIQFVDAMAQVSPNLKITSHNTWDSIIVTRNDQELGNLHELRQCSELWEQEIEKWGCNGLGEGLGNPLMKTQSSPECVPPTTTRTSCQSRNPAYQSHPGLRSSIRTYLFRMATDIVNVRHYFRPTSTRHCNFVAFIYKNIRLKGLFGEGDDAWTTEKWHGCTSLRRFFHRKEGGVCGARQTRHLTLPKHPGCAVFHICSLSMAATLVNNRLGNPHAKRLTPARRCGTMCWGYWGVSVRRLDEVRPEDNGYSFGALTDVLSSVRKLRRGPSLMSAVSPGTRRTWPTRLAG